MRLEMEQLCASEHDISEQTIRHIMPEEPFEAAWAMLSARLTPA